MKLLDRWMDNVLAARLGHIARRVAESADLGDDIDRGLFLRRLLEEEGFGLVLLPTGAAAAKEEG